MDVLNKYEPQGTDRDIERVGKTFQELNFVTWVINDPTPDVTRETVKIITEYVYNKYMDEYFRKKIKVDINTINDFVSLFA